MMRSLKIFSGVLIITFCLFAVSSYSAEVAKIGIVDFQRILMESTPGKKVQAEIKKKGEAMEQDLKSKGSDINKLQEDLQREQLVLSKERLEEKERDFRIRLNDLKSLKKKYENEMRKLTYINTDKIRKELFEVAESFGKKEGFMLIIEKTEAGVVYYPKDKMDVTDKLIQLYNAEAAKKN